jgi:predicted ester cyclase
MDSSNRRTAIEIYRDYNAAENLHDLPATTALVAVDLKVEVNGVPQVSSGADDEAAMAILYEIYPDYRREIKRSIDAGDEAVVIWIMRGTPNVQIAGILPLEVEGVSIVTADGRVLTTASLYADSAALNEALRLASKNKRGE